MEENNDIGSLSNEQENFEQAKVTPPIDLGSLLVHFTHRMKFLDDIAPWKESEEPNPQEGPNQTQITPEVRPDSGATPRDEDRPSSALKKKKSKAKKVTIMITPSEEEEVKAEEAVAVKSLDIPDDPLAVALKETQGGTLPPFPVGPKKQLKFLKYLLTEAELEKISNFQGSNNSLVILGPSGTGKSTITSLIAKTFGFVPISVPDILEEICKHNNKVSA